MWWKSLIQPKRKHLQGQKQNEFEKCTRTKHTNQSPDFFDVDSIFHEDITNHKENFGFYFNKYDFKLNFGEEFSPHFKTELENNQTINLIKRFVILVVAGWAELTGGGGV